MNKCRILWLFFAIALVLSAVSCTKYSVSEDQLVGRWQLESYQCKEYDKDGRLVLDITYHSPNPLILTTILLNSDGTGVCEDKSNDSYYVDEGNWYFSDKKITMTMSPVDIETFDVISVTSKELNLHGKEVWDDVTVEVELLFKRI